MMRKKIFVSDKRCPSSDSRHRSVFFTELSRRKISGAAFDVFREETADSNNKLLKLDNFVLIPHIAGWTYYSVARRKNFASPSSANDIKFRINTLNIEF
jgi:D-isomer specific 2-hydroxyacid dehydrogenase, NAD binding domain